jgi:hypothetical protein
VRLDLIRLSDGENSLRVEVLGRYGPGVLPLHDVLEARIVVASGFVCGRLGLCLSPEDVDDWSAALERLAAGGDVDWKDDGRDPEISVEAHNAEHGLPVVRVEDAARSGVSVVLPLHLGDGWIAEQRALLEGVRRAWPSEVRTTSPGVYEWRR